MINNLNELTVNFRAVIRHAPEVSTDQFQLLSAVGFVFASSSASACYMCSDTQRASGSVTYLLSPCEPAVCRFTALCVRVCVKVCFYLHSNSSSINCFCSYITSLDVWTAHLFPRLKWDSDPPELSGFSSLSQTGGAFVSLTKISCVLLFYMGRKKLWAQWSLSVPWQWLWMMKENERWGRAGWEGGGALQESFLHQTVIFMSLFIKRLCFLFSGDAQGDQQLLCLFNRCKVETKLINYYLKKIINPQRTTVALPCGEGGGMSPPAPAGGRSRWEVEG